MKTKLLIIALALACACGFASAQNRKALRINEVMVVNDSTSIVDDYGHYSPWIELFNANFAPLQISSIYLSNDPAAKSAVLEKGKAVPGCKLYPVPLGDERTKIGKRQTVVFFADGQPNRGTFHTSFTLDANQDNWVAIFDADSTLIDSITVPAALAAGASYALVSNDEGELEWIACNGDNHYITPGGENTIRDTNDKISQFAEKDPHGFSMAVMAMCIVFSALLILCLAFMAISKIGAAFASRNKAKSQGKTVKEIVDEGQAAHDSGEVIAAIGMALNQHLNAHDTENIILTINKVKRAYSPWSSKIYGLRQTPR